jgi:type II secretory pathway pseudopilin PulG
MYQISKGFTFAEILASLALFAVMTVAIASVLRETNTLTIRLQDRQSSIMAAELALQRMQRDLRLAYDEKIRRSPSLFKAGPGPNGFELIFSFLASPFFTLIDERSSGLQVVRYFLANDSNGVPSLYRAELPYHQASDIQNTEAEKIASGIRFWKLEFFNPRTSQWMNDWDDKGPYTGGYFPSAVRIALEAYDPELPESSRDLRSIRIETSFFILNEYSEAGS